MSALVAVLAIVNASVPRHVPSPLARVCSVNDTGASFLETSDFQFLGTDAFAEISVRFDPDCGVYSAAEDSLRVAGLPFTPLADGVLVSGDGTLSVADVLPRLRYASIAGINGTSGVRGLFVTARINGSLTSVPLSNETVCGTSAIVLLNYTVEQRRALQLSTLVSENATLLDGCTASGRLFPEFSLTDAMYCNQQDASIARCSIVIVSGGAAGRDAVEIDADATEPCSLLGTCSRCPGLTVQSNLDGSVSLIGPTSAADMQECLRRAFFRSTGGLVVGQRRVQVQCKTANNAPRVRSDVIAIDVRQRGLAESCPLFTSSHTGASLSLAVSASTPVYEIFCDCNNVTVPVLAALNVSLSKCVTRSSRMLALADVSLAAWTSFPAQDRLLFDAGACAGLTVVASFSPVGLRFQGVAFVEVYEACLRTVAYSNIASAAAQIEGQRIINVRVQAPMLVGVSVVGETRVTLAVRTAAGACTNGCPNSNPSTFSDECGILLKQCEQVKWFAPDLVNTSVCLCSTGRGNACFMPEVRTTNGTNLTSIEVCFISGFVRAQDALRYETVVPGIDWSYNDTSGCGTLTGDAPSTAFEAALRSVRYVNLALTADRRLLTAASAAIDAAGDASRSLTEADPSVFQRGLRRLMVRITTDDNCTATTAQPVLWLVPHTPVPIVDISVRYLPFTTGAQLPGGLVVDAGLVITDPDCTGLEGIQLRFLTSSYVRGEDVLKCPDGLTPTSLPISCVFNAAEGILHMWGPAPIATLQHWARKVRYCNTAASVPTRGNRILFWVAYDAESVEPSDGERATLVLDVTGATDGRSCPTVQTGELHISIIGSNTPIPVEPYVAVTSDVSGQMITSAVVRISEGYVRGEDVLSVNRLASGVTAVFNPVDGQLEFSGTANSGNYGWMLRSVLYLNTLGNAGTLGPRRISFTVRDLDCVSTPISSVITVEGPNGSLSCACTPRLSLTIGASVTLGVDESPSISLGLNTFNVAYEGPLGPALLNCSRALLTTNGFNIRYAAVAFVETSSAIHVAREDAIALAAPGDFPVVLVGSASTGDARLVVSRSVSSGQPLSVFLDALSYLTYRNVRATVATIGIRQVVVSLFATDGCFVAALYVRIRVHAHAQALPPAVASPSIAASPASGGSSAPVASDIVPGSSPSSPSSSYAYVPEGSHVHVPSHAHTTGAAGAAVAAAVLLAVRAAMH